MPNVANLGVEGLRPFRFVDPRGNMEQFNKRCEGQHDIYVAECVIAPAEGTITVVTVCRQCDRVSFHQQKITEPHKGLVSTKDEK